MTEPLIAESRSKLQQRRAELSRLAEAHRAEERALESEPEPDWPDRAAQRSGEEMLHRVTDRELAELREIDAALQRIEQGTFGECERCGEPIADKRLRAIPEARFCIECAD